MDVQQPGGAVGETALLVGPLLAVQRRLQELLVDWPEHPLLDQLLAICHRIQGGSPLTHTAQHVMVCGLAACS